MNVEASEVGWLDESWICIAATVTICAGTSVDEVLRGFGATPSDSEPLYELLEAGTTDPWVAVLDLGDGAVLAVESNGWQAAHSPTLERVSAPGRAASVYWNDNGMHALSFAERGIVVAQTQDYGWTPLPTEPPAVVEAVAGLDLGGPKLLGEGGLIAAGRFTGRSIGPAELASIWDADVAHRILPWLPEHHPSGAGTDPVARGEIAATAIGPDLRGLGSLEDAALSDLVWALAGQVADVTGLLDEPSAAQAVAERRLGAEAELLARGSKILQGNLVHPDHVIGWAALHDATNPDPFAAVVKIWRYAQRLAGEPTLGALRAASAGSGESRRLP